MEIILNLIKSNKKKLQISYLKDDRTIHYELNCIQINFIN